MQGGELAAFDGIFDKYRRAILAYVNGMLHDRSMAEDIVQETFVELARRIDSIDAERGLSGWLYRVARNRAIDAIRHRKFEVMPGEVVVADEAERAGHAGPNATMEKAAEADVLERVGAAMSRLPEKERDLLSLRFHGGLKFQEIAELLGRPLGTVLWQAQQYLEKIRAILREGDKERRE